MAIQHKAYKFRLYPNKAQTDLMEKTFGCVRKVYNCLLDENKRGYAEHGKYHKLNFNPVHLKSEFEYLSEVSATALQQSGRTLQTAYTNWFNSMSKKRKGKAVGAPKFKSKHHSKASFTLTNQKFRLTEGGVRLEKLGVVKASIDRRPSANAKLIKVTVTRNSAGQYYASVCIEDETQVYEYTNACVGIDLGLNDLFTLSNGQKSGNPKWFRENQAKLKVAQQHLARKSKGSNNYTKQRVKVAKVHLKTSNRRDWYLHNVSSELVKSYGMIFIEDLAVSNMVKNSKLAKSISDASWSKFATMLDYKCAWRGRTLVKVSRFFPSSKTCSCCGYTTGKLPLNVRKWECPSCGATLDRDVNAAINILQQGFIDLTGETISAELTEYSDGVTIRLPEPHGAEARHVEVVSRPDVTFD